VIPLKIWSKTVVSRMSHHNYFCPKVMQSKLPRHFKQRVHKMAYRKSVQTTPNIAWHSKKLEPSKLKNYNFFNTYVHHPNFRWAPENLSYSRIGKTRKINSCTLPMAHRLFTSIAQRTKSKDAISIKGVKIGKLIDNASLQ
jgi:hypothetical protein